MPEFPTVSGGAIRSFGATPGASSLATQLTAGASNNTKGAYVELAAATEFDAHWVFIKFSQLNFTNSGYLVDIAVGASTEQVIIPDLFASVIRADNEFGPYLLPVFIPRGSRVSARCQCISPNAVMRVSITLISNTMLSGGSGPSFVSAYGDVTSSQGTNVDPGGSADTDSAWTEIVSATSRIHNWLVMAVKFTSGSLGSATAWRISVGIGSSSEEVLVPDIHFYAEASSDTPYNPVVCLPCFIPAGSRLTVRVRCSNTTDSQRDIFVKLYGAG